MKIFPCDFLWGTATSAHQVEGNNTKNDWWQAEQEGKLKYKSGQACDHYHRFEADFDLVKKIGNNAHRLSIEWSRIEPEEGKWDQREIKHYQKVLTILQERKIEVMLTLHHFTNPLWFTKLGGWENKNGPRFFVRFAQYIAKELGNLVDYWITINEPMVYASQGYFNGVWPPFKKSLPSLRRVLVNLIRAHNLVYQVLHKINNNAQIGIAQNFISFMAEKDTLANRYFLKILDWFWNDWFFKKTRDHHDFIGLNYYLHFRLARATFKISRAFIDSKKAGFEISDLGWEIYPEGFKKILLKVSHQYHLPIYVTENGIATNNDAQRVRYLISYIKAMAEAMEAGADIKGYFHWSLLDNFEWAYGFGPKFGLFAVDFKTQKRTPKPSANLYRQIAQGKYNAKKD